MKKRCRPRAGDFDFGCPLLLSKMRVNFKGGYNKPLVNLYACHQPSSQPSLQPFMKPTAQYTLAWLFLKLFRSH